MPARHHLLAASFLIAAGSALAQPSGTQAPSGSPPGSPAQAQGGQPGPASPGPASPGPASPGPASPGSEAPRPGMAQPGTAQPGMAQPGTGPASVGTAPGTAPGAAITGSTTPGFLSELQAAHYLGSRLDGADVYNSANEKIADVEDIIVSDQGQVVAVVLSYGGVAGIGQTYVAVAPSQLRMRKVSDSETRVETSMTAEQLREAPKFSYSARTR